MGLRPPWPFTGKSAVLYPRWDWSAARSPALRGRPSHEQNSRCATPIPQRHRNRERPGRVTAHPRRVCSQYSTQNIANVFAGGAQIRHILTPLSVSECGTCRAILLAYFIPALWGTELYRKRMRSSLADCGPRQEAIRRPARMSSGFGAAVDCPSCGYPRVTACAA